MVYCQCGRSHDDISSLIKSGWRMLEDGSLVERAVCTCGAMIVLHTLLDGSLCSVCFRVVVGDSDDPKSITTTGVLCQGCVGRARFSQRFDTDLLESRHVPQTAAKPAAVRQAATDPRAHQTRRVLRRDAAKSRSAFR